MSTCIVFLGHFFFSGFLGIYISPYTFAAACFQIDPVGQQKVQKEYGHMALTLAKTSFARWSHATDDSESEFLLDRLCSFNYPAS